MQQIIRFYGNSSLCLPSNIFFFHSHPFTLSQGLILHVNYCETLISLLDFILAQIHFS